MSPRKPDLRKGDRHDTERNRPVILRLPAVLFDRLTAHVQRTGETKQAFIVQAVRERLDREENPSPQ